VTDGSQVPTPSTAALRRSLAIAAAACAFLAAPAGAYVLQPFAATATTVKITTHPAATVANTTAKFAWKTTGSKLKVSCRLDSGSFASCSKTHSYSHLADGTHTFTVRATGGATKSAAYRWRVDTAAPTAPTVSGGAGTWSAVPVTISAGAATDTGGSGIATYQHRSSVNGGASFGAVAAGATDKVSADGTMFVQFRALDKAGNASAWAPATPDPAATAMVDTTGPSLPVLTGGSPSWLNAASSTVQPTGTPTDAGSGFAGYEYRTSTDGGTTWSQPTPGASAVISAEGTTLVEFASLDALANASAWTAPAQVRLDRTAPSAPAVTGGSAAWLAGPSVTVSASASTDAGSGVASYEYETSTNGGSTWSSPTSAAGDIVSTQGTTLVRFAALDGVGIASPWTQATVKLDLTVPSAPTVSGGSSTWANAASGAVTASASMDSGGSGFTGYEYRSSTDGGATWTTATSGATDTVTAEADTWVQFRSVDGAGNTSAWTPATQTAAATVNLDRTAPSVPVVAGGSSGWSNAASVTVSATSTDTGSGVKSYQYQTSTNGGSSWSAAQTGSSVVVSAVGTTLVQFRATDNANIQSAWSGVTAGGTVQIDRTVPTAPTSVTGGSLAWQLAAPVTISASGSTDSGGAGLAGYQYRTSIDGGTTWSGANPAPAAISTDGTTLVQMRAVDAAGNPSSWAPASAGAANTVKLDTTAPTAPLVAGGTGGWSTAASVPVTASGSTDSPGSGVAGYQYEISTDNGTTWSSASSGASTSISAEGTTLVRFQALDNAGRASAWTQVSVQLDRTPPTLPNVAGGALAWSAAASRTISASGSSDAGSGFAGYEHRFSIDGGGSWSSPVSGTSLQVPTEGETLVEFRSVDALGNASAWTPAPVAAAGTVRLDRTPPTTPTPSGGSASWLNATSLDITAANTSTDTGGSGVASYQHRTSINGGSTWSAAATGATVTVSAQGTTVVEFRAVDGVGLMSPWSSISAGGTAKLDQTVPTVPTITGGSNSYKNTVSTTLTAAGSTDTGGSGLAGYQYRSEFDLSNVWSGASDGAQVTISAEGLTIVQFRAVDHAGNVSDWEPFAAYPGDIVKLDRTPASLPNVSGGSLSWSAATSMTLTASGASDGASAFVSGLSGYQYRTSPDGTNWSSAASGASAAVSGQGTTFVQFRSVDAAGNSSAWTPATPDATDTVKLDRTAPTALTVLGVPGGCVAGPVTLTATGSTDPMSGLDHYESTVNGGGAVQGANVQISGHGTYTVKLRAVDAVGNATAWVTASVCLS
jgi:hypothetical protein